MGAAPPRICRPVREAVRRATVELALGKARGLGVLVPGDLVLTAAHCVPYEPGGEMASENPHPVLARTRGSEYLLDVYAAEHVSDVAVLDLVVDDCYYDSTTPSFYGVVSGVPLCTRDFRPDEPFPVWVYTPRKEIRATALLSPIRNWSLCLETKQPIPSGASGGPVVTADGELVGVVSRAPGRDTSGVFRFGVPLLSRCLPVRVVDRIRREMRSPIGSSG